MKLVAIGTVTYAEAMERLADRAKRPEPLEELAATFAANAAMMANDEIRRVVTMLHERAAKLRGVTGKA